MPARPRVRSIQSSVISQSTPTVTWAPWKPVSVKKDEPKRFVLIVSPSWTNEVNSYAWKPRKVAPMSAVAASQNCDERWMRSHQPAPAASGLPLSWTAWRASTIANDDMSSTKVEADVTGMSRMGLKTWPVSDVHASCGKGPTTDLPL